MSNQYTPTTETVRDVYGTAVGIPEARKRRELFDRWLYVQHIEAAAVEFDRWHAAEIAAAEQRGKAEGWDEAMKTKILRLISESLDSEAFQMPANPYREQESTNE